MSEELEIYYSDLNEIGKKKLLKFFNIKNPKEMNLEVFPITVIPIGE